LIYIALDTNIWLYLANGLDPVSNKDHGNFHFELLDKLRDFVKREEITILINEVIIKEWERNKEHTKHRIEKLKRKVDDPKQAFAEIRKYVSSNVDKIEKEFIAGLERDIELNEEHINKVQTFLKEECKIVPVADELKLKVFNLSISGKAPFHNKKNNIADASILFSIVDYFNGLSGTEENQIIFVSNNTDDFTDGKNKEEFHPDIQKELDNQNIQYQRVLPAALELSQTMLVQIEEYRKHEAWLESVSFGCMSELCVHSESFTPWGYLDREIEVKYESAEAIDPDQLDLFPELPREPKETKKVGIGECVICSTTHLICPECDELIYIEEATEKFSYPECHVNLHVGHDGKPYLLVHDIKIDAIEK
jgi:predicted nucleic acid-binding protein